MEALTLSRRKFLKEAGIVAYQLLDPAARAPHPSTEGEPSSPLKIIQTGEELLETEGGRYRVKANPKDIAELTRYLARSAEYQPDLLDKVEEQFRTTPLQVNIAALPVLTTGYFTPPNQNPHGPYPRIDIDPVVPTDLLKQQQRIPTHDLDTIPHTLKNFLDFVDDPEKFLLHQRIRRDTTTGIAVSSAVGGAIAAKKAFGNEVQPDTPPDEQETSDPLRGYRKKIGRGPLDRIALGGIAAFGVFFAEAFAAKSIIDLTGNATEDSSYRKLPSRLEKEPKLRELAVHTFDFETLE
jgi:hypothetical protein